MKFFENDTNTVPMATGNSVAKLRIKDFLDRDFRSFSAYDCWINIPNMMDGFKISQRKSVYVINGANRMNTVERFSSQVASETAYHHGAANLEGVIVGLAQDFTTSNNVNWFTPDGGFGSILDHKASSGRYISVDSSPNFRKWFSKDDDIILEYEYEDGEKIEPKYFIPKVPTLLFNGASGIGTGYSTTILSYNPSDVVRNVLQVLQGKKQTKLVPWYRGWTGDIRKIDGQTTFTGKFERVGQTKIRITEIPVGYDQDKMKTILINLMDKNVIRDYDDNSTESGWDITVHVGREFLQQTDDVIIRKLGLESRESENIVVWDHNHKIRVFDSPEDLIEYFVSARIELYEKRRVMLINATNEKIAWAEERARFINFYLERTEKFRTMKKAEITDLLLKEKFVNVDKLLSMPIWNLTGEKIQELKSTISDLKVEVETLEGSTAKDMYLSEVKAIKS